MCMKHLFILYKYCSVSPTYRENDHLLPHSVTRLPLSPPSTEAMEVIPLSEPSPAPEASSSQPGSAPSDPKPLSPQQDGTAQQIMQLLQEIQNPQGVPRPPPFLGENPCIPFFYRPDEQDEVKILVV